MPTLLKNADPAELREIYGVCLDIDDTLSTHGKITAEAFSALWELKRAGFAVVPITGRPAGWCDHIARFWPVDGVVGENGAFTFYLSQEGGGLKAGPRVRKRINTPGATIEARKKLAELSKAIRAEFAHAQWASDQEYREFDLAIDFCEDVAPWTREQVARLVKVCEKVGAHAKVSSIHVNAWFGDYNKRSGFEHWLAQGAPGLEDHPKHHELTRSSKNWLYIGDSPNDEPMFEAFFASVGVANISNFLKDLKHPPRWITQSESGAGFAEMAAQLIALKS